MKVLKAWKIGFFLFILFFENPLEAAARVSTKKSPLSSYEELQAIGVRTFSYQDEKRNRPVIVEIWYPSDAEHPLDLPVDGMWIHPKEMRDVPWLESVESLPLILMSHGHGGDRRNHSWLADRLVRSGFVVASVDHYGNTTSSFSLPASLRFWERGKDISFAIDRLLDEPFLKERIDPNRIGFVGYSLGGMTGLGLAGAEPGALEEVLNQIMKKRKEIQPEMIAGVSLQEAKQPFKDERIQAMILICPATFVYPPDSLKKIKIPIGLVAAPQDEVLPFKEHAELIIQYVVPARLKMMHKKTSHYAFLNRVSEEGKKFFKKHFPDRALVHQEVGPFAVDFFREFLFTK